MLSRRRAFFGLFVLASTFSCSSPTEEQNGDRDAYSQPSPSSDDSPASSNTPSEDEGEPSAPSGSTSGNDDVSKVTEGEPTVTNVATLTYDGNFPTYIAPLIGAKAGIAHLFPNITIENPSEQAKTVVLRASLQGYTKEDAVATIKLEPKGKASGWFDAALDFEALDKVTSPVSAQFNVSLTTPEGKVLFAMSRAAQVLSKRTVFWSGIFKNKDGTPSTGLAEGEAVAGLFTTPSDHRGEVDRLLQKAATFSAYGHMYGYSSCPNGTSAFDCTKDQVGAIYKALQSMGFNYTSVSNNYFKSSQEIRYPAESLTGKTGNCIDGTLVFTSALEAIGMLPKVVYITGHAFLAVATGPVGTEGNKTAVVVETTMVGNKARSFDDAINSAVNTYNNAVNNKDPQLMIIDIAIARANGYLASPFPM